MSRKINNSIGLSPLSPITYPFFLIDSVLFPSKYTVSLYWKRINYNWTPFFIRYLIYSMYFFFLFNCKRQRISRRIKFYPVKRVFTHQHFPTKRPKKFNLVLTKNFWKHYLLIMYYYFNYSLHHDKLMTKLQR